MNAAITFASYVSFLDSSSQNRDLKCNRICKLPVSLFCLDTFYDPYSFILNYQFFDPHKLFKLKEYTKYIR